MRSRRSAGFLILFWAFSNQAWAAGATGHSDPVAPVLLALMVILAVAKLGSELFERLGMPAVLGELVGGVALGNLILVHPEWNFFEPLRAAVIRENWAVVIDVLARIGVIVLLFEVGLESSVQAMVKVGPSSLLVALLGVVAPFLLGFGVSWLFIKELPAPLEAVVPAGFSLTYVHLFIGAVLCATSVGITARVFRDLGKLQTQEARIILGAAVIDDVLGLVILAVVSGMVAAAELGQPLQMWSLVRLVGVAILFLGGSLALGVWLIPRMMKQLAKLRTAGMMLISSLLFGFALSYLASAAGLAAIVGAFAAGLILEEVHFRGFREQITIEQLLRPLATFLVPIFFVLMGIQVRLEAFANPSVLAVAAGITLAAVAGKQVCGLGVLEKGLDRVTVGVGMIPRGEVGLIFADIGKDLKVIDDATFSAVVIMVMATTLLTPPLLKLTISRRERKALSRQT
ncbi:MAG: cation:proton antiporter [Acidobacteria bacterium]|nr:cation:proton antiporter [Acidobacteriota bacterium]